ncbi:hypothetical protein ILUMI_08572 [Ignelater luminosus]|uniref:Uncharacterized protein n=1 Tax=Ignelater luminosus TaxID=2038154 RepID=A0A8K0D6M7_IGNLU|nr:hypothetical protein ILUMI_08572 [Ignelater luminosus]
MRRRHIRNLDTWQKTTRCLLGSPQQHSPENQRYQKIRTAPLQNGFSERNINKAFEPPKPKTEEEKEKPIAKAYLPYVKETTDKISRILSKHKIETTFNTDRKISTILPNSKTKINLENQGLYKIPYRNCNRSYVGQTNTRMNVRKEEHQNAVQKNKKPSSLAQHVKATSHTINFENTRSITNIEHKTKRRKKCKDPTTRKCDKTQPGATKSESNGVYKPPAVAEKINSTRLTRARSRQQKT